MKRNAEFINDMRTPEMCALFLCQNGRRLKYDNRKIQRDNPRADKQM